MTETNEPGGPHPRAVDPEKLRPGGGCGCGPVGCITVMVALCALLLVVAVIMALVRPGMNPPLPQVR